VFLSLFYLYEEKENKMAIGKISVSSELMKNQVAGSLLPRQKQLEVVQKNDGTPLAFSINDKGDFLLTAHDAKSLTGWRQLNLLESFNRVNDTGANLKAQAFAVSQDKSGVMWVSLSVSDDLSGPSRLFLSKGLLNDFANLDIQYFDFDWHPRELPAGTKIAKLLIGNNDDKEGPPLVLAVAEDNKKKIPIHYRINPDFNDPSWTYSDLTLPEDADECLSVAIGTTEEKGRGVYALYRIGPSYNLEFTALPKIFGKHTIIDSVQLGFPAALNPCSIAAVSNDEGLTDLYVAGDGLFYYPPSVQNESYGRGVEVADNTLFTGTKHLVVRQNKNRISVWGCNNKDQLIFTTSENTEKKEWQLPINMANECNHAAAYRHTEADANVVFISKNDGSLEYFNQDPQTTQWHMNQMSLFHKEEFFEFDSYTTEVAVTDESNLPIPNATLKVKSTSDCTVKINGEYYLLKSDLAKEVTTDETGRLSIVRQTSDISAPMYHFEADFLAEKRVVDPCDKVKEGLRKIKTPSDLKEARKRNGKRLLPEHIDTYKCEQGVKMLHTLLEVDNSLPQDGSLALAKTESISLLKTAAPGHLRGIVLDESGQFRYVEGDEAREALRRHSEEDLSVQGLRELFMAFGDFLRWIGEEIKHVVSFFVEKIKDGFAFVVQIGKQVIKFIFECAEQVFAAINWVFKKLFDIDLEQFIEWLGFLFQWDDILTTHRVIRNMVNLTLYKAIDSIDDFKVKSEDFFKNVREKLIDGKLKVDHSNEIFRRRLKQGEDDHIGANTPQVSWGMNHLKNHVNNIDTDTVNITQKIEHIFTDFFQAEADTFKNAFDEVIHDICDEIDNLTLGEIFERVLLVISEFILNTVENVWLGFLDITELIIQVFMTILNARWNIPVITHLYEKVICKNDGSQLTLLDAACLLTAIPATVLYKMAAGRNIFSNEQAELIKKAATFDNMLDALINNAPPVLHGTQSLATGGDGYGPCDQAEVAMQWLATAARIGSSLAFPFTEFGKGKPKQIGGKVKLSFDWFQWCFSFIITMIVGARKDQENPWNLSTRKWLDMSVSWGQIFFRIKDSILVGIWDKTGNEVPKPGKIVASSIEAGFGVAMIILVSISAAEQCKEDPPTHLPESAHSAYWGEVGLKIAQNECSGVYRVLSPFRYVPEPYDNIAKITRLILVILVLGCSSFRALLESHYNFSDLDD